MNSEYSKVFGRIAHDSIEHKRKYSGEPYWTHTEAVADTIARIGGDDDSLQAAHLHDYREDVVTALLNSGRFETLGYLETMYHFKFNEKVKSLVSELTDVFTKERFPHLNRAKRKALEAERISRISNEAKTIKLADLIDNTKSITLNDPKFAETYLKEKAQLLKALVGGNPVLMLRAQEVIP